MLNVGYAKKSRTESAVESSHSYIPVTTAGALTPITQMRPLNLKLVCSPRLGRWLVVVREESPFLGDRDWTDFCGVITAHRIDIRSLGAALDGRSRNDGEIVFGVNE